MLLLRAGLIAVSLLASTHAAYALKCGPLEPTKPTKYEKEIEGKLKGNLSFLSQKLGTAEFAGKYRSLEHDILAEFPDADKLYMRDRAIYLLCALLDESDMSDEEKFEKYMWLIGKWERGTASQSISGGDKNVQIKGRNNAVNIK